MYLFAANRAMAADMGCIQKSSISCPSVMTMKAGRESAGRSRLERRERCSFGTGVTFSSSVSVMSSDSSNTETVRMRQRCVRYTRGNLVNSYNHQPQPRAFQLALATKTALAGSCYWGEGPGYNTNTFPTTSTIHVHPIFATT